MSRLNLRDLPAEIVEKLKPLSHHDFDLLSIEAGRMRDEDKAAEYPTNIEEAVKAAWEVFTEKAPALEIESPLGEVESALRIATMILGSRQDLDACDCQHLADLLDRAETIIRQEERRREELRDWLFRIIRPVRF